MPAPTTPCPKCGTAIRVKGERGLCPSCGQAVRFVDAPEVACSGCGRPVALPSGRQATKCGQCGTWTADVPDRLVIGKTTCPRCRRTIDVPLDAGEATCPRCHSRLALQDTL